MNRKEPLSITRQCAVLDIPRSTFYHRPSPVSDADLELMRLIDRCHTELPFYGSRRMVTWLADEGHRVNRKRVQRLTCLQQAGAHDGDCGNISETQSQPDQSGASGVPVPAAEVDRRPP